MLNTLRGRKSAKAKQTPESPATAPLRYATALELWQAAIQGEWHSESFPADQPTDGDAAAFLALLARLGPVTEAEYRTHLQNMAQQIVQEATREAQAFTDTGARLLGAAARLPGMVSLANVPASSVTRPRLADGRTAMVITLQASIHDSHPIRALPAECFFENRDITHGYTVVAMLTAGTPKFAGVDAFRAGADALRQHEAHLDAENRRLHEEQQARATRESEMRMTPLQKMGQQLAEMERKLATAGTSS